jgi:hypothetical protein
MASFPVTANTIQLDEIVRNARHSILTNLGEEQLLRILMNVRVSDSRRSFTQLYYHSTILFQAFPSLG